MKTIILILIVLFSLTRTFAQDSTYYRYNKIISQAKVTAKKGELMKSLSLYDSAFKIIDCISYDYFDAFSVAISDSNYQKANEYLVRGALKGLDLSIWITEEVNLFNKSIYAEKYNLIKDSLLNLHLKSIDNDYYQALLEMKSIDQSVRKIGDKQIMLYKDSLNFVKLISLSKEKGFPTFLKTGYGCNIAWLLLWHHRGAPDYPNSKLWQEIIPLINSEIYKGTLDPQFFVKFDEFLLQEY